MLFTLILRISIFTVLDFLETRDSGIFVCCLVLISILIIGTIILKIIGYRSKTEDMDAVNMYIGKEKR